MPDPGRLCFHCSHRHVPQTVNRFPSYMCFLPEHALFPASPLPHVEDDQVPHVGSRQIHIGGGLFQTLPHSVSPTAPEQLALHDEPIFPPRTRGVEVAHRAKVTRAAGDGNRTALLAVGRAKLSAAALYTNRTNLTSGTHHLGSADLVDVSLDPPEITVSHDLPVPLLSPHERGGGPADRYVPGNQSSEPATAHQAVRVPIRRETSCDWLNQLVQEHEVRLAKYNTILK